MPSYRRPELDLIPPYVPGKPAREIAGVPGVKLSSNENPFDPLPSVKAAVSTALAEMNRYPDVHAGVLSAVLAQRLGVRPDNLAFGAGSVEVASQLIHATTGFEEEVMFAWRSFEAYPILARVAGAVPVAIPLTADAAHDLPRMADAISDRTRLIFVCNPNNPTGTVTSRAQLEEFMARVPSCTTVVIDEAYLHFNDRPGTALGIDFFHRYDNVAVLHTFSKAYGLAGLRLGYAIAQAELAEALRKTAIPFSVTALAQAAGIASLAAEAELAERVGWLIRERERVYRALIDLGLPALPSGANFVWLAFGPESASIARALTGRGIAVRLFADEGIRVTIGSESANERLLAEAATIARSG